MTAVNIKVSIRSSLGFDSLQLIRKPAPNDKSTDAFAVVWLPMRTAELACRRGNKIQLQSVTRCVFVGNRKRRLMERLAELVHGLDVKSWPCMTNRFPTFLSAW